MVCDPAQPSSHRFSNRFPLQNRSNADAQFAGARCPHGSRLGCPLTRGYHLRPLISARLFREESNSIIFPPAQNILNRCHVVFSCEPSLASPPRLQVHGFLMVLVWAVLFPAGIISARFFRHLDPLWWNLHRGFQGVGVFFFVIAWLLGWKAEGTREKGMGTHLAFAFLLPILVIMQVG